MADPFVLLLAQVNGRCLFTLHAIDLDMRCLILDGRGNPRKQSAAASRNNNVFNVRALFKDFKPYRTLTGNDHGIIIGMNKISASFLLDFHGLSQGFIKSFAVKDNIGAIALGCLDLGQGGSFRHDDRGTNGVHGPAESNALGMVAGRGRNDPTLLLFRAQGHDAV